MDTYFDFFAKIIISFLGVSLFRSISYSVDRYYLNNEHLRDIYEKKLDLYKQLYFAIVANPLGKPVDKSQGIDFVKKFVVDLNCSDELFLLVSPELLKWFKLYSNKEEEKYFSYIKDTVNYDFNHIKHKLGYESELKVENRTYFVIVGVLSLTVSTTFSWIERVSGLKHYDYNSLIFLTLLTFSLLFAGFYYLYRKYPFLYRGNKK